MSSQHGVNSNPQNTPPLPTNDDINKTLDDFYKSLADHLDKLLDHYVQVRINRAFSSEDEMPTAETDVATAKEAILTFVASERTRLLEQIEAELLKLRMEKEPYDTKVVDTQRIYWNDCLDNVKDLLLRIKGGE